MAINYLQILGDCFPDAEATIPDNLDPSVYSNLVWITTPIDQATLDVSDCANVDNPVTIDASAGGIYTMTFCKENSAKNTWLSHEGDNSNTSNKVPAVVPIQSKVIGITFSNSLDGTDQDVEIYSSAAGAGNADTKKITWAIRNCRVANTTEITPNVVFDAGEKVGVYIRDQGTNNKYVTVVIYLQITGTTANTSTENYSGNF